ncbi:SDR family NAD(P)-dependent oxidoreductase [Georgenia sp. Z1344]|uniref:SDR family NAD(P)-dependent oxidoreductase n=1 Tax=Georgenia sp. Z1344 TaxID=3416706 RepID=UPI003CF2AF5E
MTQTATGPAVLVTGGGSGIGRGVTDRFVADGARVTVLERSESNAARLRQDHGDAVRVVVGDAADADTVSRAVDEAGVDGGLDHLTCCVGVFDQYASIRELDAAALEQAAVEIWRLNVLTTLLAVNAAYPALRARRGSVTLTLSESAFHPVGGGVLYGSSKWALRGVVAHLAADLAPEVRVNGVAPGGTGGTRFGGLSTLDQTSTADQDASRDARIAAGTLLGRTPTPADHAGAYSYLADAAQSGIVTGIVINTDGGRRH